MNQERQNETDKKMTEQPLASQAPQVESPVCIAAEPGDTEPTAPLSDNDISADRMTEPAKQEAKDAPATDLPSSVEVVGVRFRQSGKVYYFAPGNLHPEKGCGVIVETARGLEYGTVTASNRMVSAKEIVPPLRPVVRIAGKEDIARHQANLEKETEAFNLCLEKIEELHLEMKLVDVEYAFDNSKLLFYFTAEGRIDFRDLVKHLASFFRTRIELRQIGIRDEAKMRGGLGICGRPFCCSTFLNDFVQVSIKMAKEQNLSLNSSKISGTCGRLMCCLRYEYDAYVEEIAKTPKVDAVVTTPDGDGYITEISPLVGICRVKLLSAPDAVQKYYHRDDLTFKGIYRKDLAPHVLNPQKEEKAEEPSRGKHASRRSSRRPDRAEKTKADRPVTESEKAGAPKPKE